MKDRFDLEDEIMKCWEIIDDLELINNHSEITSEQYRELIKSLHTLYSLKFTTLFSTFEKCIENKEFE